MFQPFPVRRTLPAALALLAAAHAPAQDQDVVRAIAGTRSPIASAARPDGSSAGTWAAGADYKASFHDGMTFHPYVGPALPHQPLRWRTVAAGFGGDSLLDATRDRLPSPSHGDWRCEYDLGDLVERYDVLDNGLEQSFVVERPGTGDLVIRGAIETPLQVPEAAPASQALRFSLADGRAVIEYGAAVAIDAAGRRFPVTTACSGREITLRLAAAHVAEAAFPLVVDPLIANALGNGAEITDSDVLHETLSPAASAARTWVAYVLEVAAGDGDVWVKRLDTDFTGTPIDAFRENSLWDAAHPRLALAPAASEVVVVCSSGPVGPTPMRFLLIHDHLVTDLVLRTSTVNPFGAINEQDWRPDVGGRAANGDKVLVVWQRDNGATFANTSTSAVYAGVYDATNDNAAVPAFVVRNRPNQDQERPVVNQIAEGNEWLVAFQEHDGTVANDDWDVPVLAIDVNGTIGPVVNPIAQAAVATQHKVGPEIAGSGGRYCLVYGLQQFVLAQPKPQDARGESLWAQRIDYDHVNDVATIPHAEVELRTAVNPVLNTGGIAHDTISDSHWCVVTRNVNTGVLEAMKLGYRGAIVESFSATPATGVTLVPGGVTFCAASREFLLLHGRNDGSANGNTLVGSRVQYDAVPAPTTYGFGCGPAVIAGLGAMVDKQQIGAQGLRFVVDNVPQNGIAFALLSLRNASVPLGPFGLIGCDLLVDPAPSQYLGIVVAPVANNRGSFTMDLVETLAPFRLAVQWFHPAPGANPANLLGSNALDITVGR